MDEETRDPLTESFPSNRKMVVKTEPEKLPEGKKLEKVITGTARRQKRGWRKRLTETFLEDDTKNVGGYILRDVLLPAAKSAICDVVGWGGFAEMLLFGGKRNGGNTRSSRSGGRSYTSYGSFHRTTDNRDRERDISKVGRARHDFDEIKLDSRGEAEEVLSHLVDLTIDYGVASVADLYDLVGITSSFTDNKYGWTDLRNASVSRVRDGYLLNLPRTSPLD